MTQRIMRRIGGVAGLALAATLLVAAPAWAQQSSGAADQSVGLGLKGIGVRLGLTDPEDVSSALMYGVHVDAGQLVKNVHILPAVEYWSVGSELSGYNIDTSDLALKVNVNFDFPLQGQRMVPYLGGAFGWHKFKVDSNIAGTEDVSDTKFGFDVQGGARNQFTPNLSLFGELGYSFVSDVSQLRLLGGLTYHFIY